MSIRNHDKLKIMAWKFEFLDSLLLLQASTVKELKKYLIRVTKSRVVRWAKHIERMVTIKMLTKSLSEQLKARNRLRERSINVKIKEGNRKT